LSSLVDSKMELVVSLSAYSKTQMVEETQESQATGGISKDQMSASDIVDEIEFIEASADSVHINEDILIGNGVEPNENVVDYD